MGGVEEPVDPTLALGLRREVLRLRSSERRRRFPVQVFVGIPGRTARRFAEGGADLDAALRTEVVAALLARASPDGGEPPTVWLTRAGELHLHDADALWLEAAIGAYAEAGLPMRLLVVTRRGWYDPRSGVRREWKRLRRPGVGSP